MKIIAERIVTELSEQNIERLSTFYEVEPKETVEDLMRRVKMDGSAHWHYDLSEVRLKLVKE